MLWGQREGGRRLAQKGGKRSKVNSKDREGLASEGVTFYQARKGRRIVLNGAVNILGVFKGEDF